MSAPAFRATLARDDYLLFCDRVRRLSGVDLAQYKRNQMERRVRAFAQRRGTPDLAAYGARLARDAGELDAFLDRVTINVSHLWRHEDQWTAIGRTILPELAAAGRTVRCWSAGSSYGAEAFTLAAVARDAVPAARVDIQGTDLDRRMVERAREGRFSRDDARLAPTKALQRWFVPADDGGWQARPELRRMTRFAVGDLLRMPVPSSRFDLIMCRNTVIYFTEEVRDALHARLAAALSPGGYLVVGTSERVTDPRGLGLASPLPFIYRKGS